MQTMGLTSNMESGDQTGAKANGGLSIDGSNECINAANDSSNLNVGETFTVEAWIKRDTSGAFDDGLLTKAWDTQYSFKLSFSSDKLRLDSVNGGVSVESINSITDTTSWHYVAGYSKSSDIGVFIDGAFENWHQEPAALVMIPVVCIWAPEGGRVVWTTFFGGQIDEVRISNTERNACWIGATYNSINAPGRIFTH